MQPRPREYSRSWATACFVLSSVAAIIFLASCASTSQHTAPPVLTYAATNVVYTRGTAVTPDTPSNSGGAVSTYAAVPALPAGLSLNSTTGIIGGTPTVVAAQALYTVTGSNAGGASSAAITITVNDVAPSGLAYSANPAVYAAAAAISPDVPNWSSAGGTPVSFAVTGSLPQGLSLDTATGIISGTPTAQTPTYNYTITATNTGGSTSSTLTLTVIPQAPYFITQPASQYVGSGISTYFVVNVGGGGILGSYQWYKNGAAVAVTSIDEYVTPVVTSSDNGDRFYVVVSDNYNRSITSNTATLTVKGVSGAFVNTGTPGIARDCSIATLLQNGQVLVVGGRNGNNALASAELYDPSTGIFTGTGSLATARCYFTATLLTNGKVLVAGGWPVAVGVPTIGTAELYDPATGLFSPTGSLGTSRNSQSATLLTSGKVLIAGGVTSSDGYKSSELASAELYDPVAGTFSATGSLNTARSPSAALLNNGQVLVTGGGLASAELYDPSTGTFSFTGSLNLARGGNTETLLQNGKVLVAGGDTQSGQSAELYDPSSGTFTATGSLNTVHGTPTATLLPDGQVLIVGGSGGWDLGLTLNMTELYDPASGVFIFNAPTNTNRFGQTATLLNNGQVLIDGQGTSAVTITPPSPAELYEP